MVKSVNRGRIVKNLVETHENLDDLTFGILTSILVWSKKIFEEVSQSFYTFNVIIETCSLLWASLAYKWSYNKNAHRTGNVILDFANFGFSTFVIFGSATLLAVTQIALYGVMLAINPFICLAKSIYHTGKILAADNPIEAEAHYNRVKENVISAVISGGIGLILGSLFLIPALPEAATVALATVASAIIIPPVILGLGTQIAAFGKWASKRLGKWWRKQQGLQGPGHRYDIRSGKDVDINELEPNIIYVDKQMEDGIGHQYLSYLIKDDTGSVRRGEIKQYTLPYESWPKDLSETEIQKLRPHFDSFASSFLRAKKVPLYHSPEKEELIDRTDVALGLAPTRSFLAFKPVLRPSTKELQPQYYASSTSYAAPSEQAKSYYGKERTDYYAHWSAPALKSVDEVTAEAQRQINALNNQLQEPLQFFQNQKRQNKIAALNVLVLALNQWNELFENKFTPPLKYHSIQLDQDTEISRVLNPHLDPDVTRHREFIIKRIEQCVLSQYSDVYQSFFRHQGSVATLFQQGFDLMRRMKTQEEIHQEREDIQNEINAYEDKYQGLRRHFQTDSQQENRVKSIGLLNDFLDGCNNAEQIDNNEEMKSSRIANGTRWQIYQRIMELKESEELLYNSSRIESENLGTHFFRDWL